jgi:hypothetical protein
MMSLRLGTTAMVEARRSGVRHGRPGIGALQPVADDAAYGRKCPIPAPFAISVGIGSVGW